LIVHIWVSLTRLIINHYHNFQPLDLNRLLTNALKYVIIR
jgi:hypothetical protein